MVVFYNIPQEEVKNYMNFHLSIEITQSTVSLLLVDKANQKPVAIENLSMKDFSLDMIFGESEIVSKTVPNSVSCCFINSVFTLIPNPLFSESKKTEYLSFSSQSNFEYDVIVDKHLKQNITTCFGVETKIKKTILSFFPLAVFKHNSTILCDSLSDGFHLNFASETEFEVVMINEKKLLFYNHYTSENKEEVMYYLTLIAEKLSINIQETSIKVSGVINKKGKLMSYLNQFIPEKNLTFNEIESSQLNAIDTHKHFSLHKQFQCVS